MSEDARLVAKLALEAELARPLSQVLGGYITTWAETEGNVPLAQRIGFHQALRGALERHYARVVSASLGEMPSPSTEISGVALSLQHGEKLRARAHERALYMITAIERDLTSILTAIVAGEAAATSWAPQVAPKSASADLETKKDGDKPKPGFIGFGTRFQATAVQAYYRLRSRLRSMVNIETEETAEEAIFEWVKRKRGNAAVVKIWQTVGDERVRHSHVAAGETYGPDGAIPVDEPFQLAGGRVMFPGDGSMGASLGELINCRCSTHYYAQAPDGALTPIGLMTPSIPARRTWRPGDRFGEEIPIRATEVVTLNGNTRARVVLGDNRTQATMSQPSASVINVSVDGQVVARATHDGGAVRTITLAPGREGLGIERLIRESVSHSWARRPRQ